MSHRIREAMAERAGYNGPKLDGSGMTVEADETYHRPKGSKPRLWSDPAETPRGVSGLNVAGKSAAFMSRM